MKDKIKRFLQDNKESIFISFIGLLFFRLFLFLIEKVSVFIPLREGYIGPIPWANFDGVHYLSIAQNGYAGFEQAFFPLFPFLIKILSMVLQNNYLISGVVVTHISLIVAIIFLYKLVLLDYSKKTALWVVVFFLLFPTGFFLGVLYTESLFLALVFSSFYLIRKQKWFAGSVLAALASATRLVGIFLVPSLLFELYEQNKHKVDIKKNIQHIASIVILAGTGLLSYMVYLWTYYKDPLLFIHVQPGFGANRSGGEIILLPQVIWRYIKIFLTVPFTAYDFWISVLEFIMLFVSLVIIILAYKKGIRKSYIVFSLFSLILPTLSGTLSSIPRYALSCFVIFIFFATIENKYIKYSLLTINIILQMIFASFFVRGYFVS